MMKRIALYHIPTISQGSEAKKARRKGRGKRKKLRKKGGQDKTLESRLEGKRKMGKQRDGCLGCKPGRPLHHALRGR